MKNDVRPNVEILAPAGSAEGMKAAMRGGADACYIGGKLFGARKFAENPDEDTLLSCIDYAHIHGKKLYLTINTLLKENELREQLYDFLKPYYEEGVDGVLVQDLGVMKFIHEYFPDLPIHASTQMTICDPGVMAELKRFDVKRIVLSRELSVDEIAAFKKKTDAELEVFVHGALCVCYSGQCLLSAMKGGRSGNRGECAQPCRLAYNTYAGDKIIKGDKYTLSPKDICTLRYLPDLIEAGADSLKIEGRMKKPEYAALTSSLYRKWADIYYEEEAKEAGGGRKYFNSEEGLKRIEKAVFELSDIYNRGGFSDGYLFMHNGAEMMATKRPNHNGVLVGRITGTGDGRDPYVMRIHAGRKLYAHDVLEVRNDAEPDKAVYEFTLGNGIDAGTDFTSRFTHGLPVTRGLSVYRTRNQTLINSIDKHIIGNDEKTKIRAVFTGAEGKRCKLRLTSGLYEVELEGPMCETPKNSPLDYDRVKEALGKIGDTFYELEDVEIAIGNIFIPMSELNEFRRKAVNLLTGKIVASYKRKNAKPYRFTHTPSSAVLYDKPAKLMVMVSSIKQLEATLSVGAHNPNLVVCLNMDLLGTKATADGVVKAANARVPAVIRFPSVLRLARRNDLMNYFKGQNGKFAIANASGFMIRSLEEYTFLRHALLISPNPSGFPRIIADTGLYVFNSEAAETLRLLGIEHYAAPIEQDISDIRDVRAGINAISGKHERNMTVVVYGRQQLMTTAQCQWKLRRACKKSNSGFNLPDVLYIENSEHPEQGKLPVATDCESCLNLIFDDKPIDLRSHISEFKTIGAEYFRVDLTFENEAETEKIVKESLSCLR